MLDPQSCLLRRVVIDTAINRRICPACFAHLEVDRGKSHLEVPKFAFHMNPPIDNFVVASHFGKSFIVVLKLEFTLCTLIHSLSTRINSRSSFIIVYIE